MHTLPTVEADSTESGLLGMPIGSLASWPGSDDETYLLIMRHEDPEGPWWEVHVHDLLDDRLESTHKLGSADEVLALAGH